MNYTSQEEHDHFEGAAEQSVPQEPVTPTDKILEEFEERYANAGIIGDRKFKEYLPHTFQDIKDFISSSINQAIAEERARVRGIIDWELTPHGYESDDKYMEHFACELKEKYKNKILSSLDTLTDKE